MVVTLDDIEFVSNSGAELHEMTDAEVSALVDRLNSVIFTNDYPTYKLATSAPSGDYTEKIAGLFTDTKVNSSGNAETVNTYNLYRRTAMTAPTAIGPVALKEVAVVQEHFKVFKKCQMQKLNTRLDKEQKQES